MNSNISNILKELEAIDSEIITLVNLKDTSNEAGQLANICVESIQKRIQVISFAIFNLNTELNLTDPTSFPSDQLVASFLSSLLSKVLLKTIVLCNNNLQVFAPIANKLQNRDSGLIAEFNKLSECIDSLTLKK